VTATFTEKGKSGENVAYCSWKKNREDRGLGKGQGEADGQQVSRTQNRWLKSGRNLAGDLGKKERSPVS